MNAYRFGREQRKAVATFRTDGSKDTSGNAVIENDDRTGHFAFQLTDDQARLRWSHIVGQLGGENKVYSG